MRNENLTLANTPLGKTTNYISQYQRDLLYPISRQPKRNEIGITGELPFIGHDIWNAYEISYLNSRGKPEVALGEFIVPCESPYIVESKSLKLYLYSLNNTSFASMKDVEDTIIRDLSETIGAKVSVVLSSISTISANIKTSFDGICIDHLDIACDTYTTQPSFLTTDKPVVTETLYSDLLRSNCLVTGQPDWGSIQISYTGHQIQHEGLLKYIVSFRNHIEFHEQCVERIFTDIMGHCAPEKLLVYARYNRRGGLDINPYRSNYKIGHIANCRLWRQ